MNFSEVIAFAIAATVLLGSPGPGITALVAVGRSFSRPAALRFYGSMQVGLAIAAGLSAVGLASLIRTSPTLEILLMSVGTVYLIWLAWQIATAPVGGGEIGDQEASTLTDKGAFLLGAANPKAYLAFASLLGSFTLLQGRSVADGALKWAICVAVMVIVDFCWLLLGMSFGKIKLSARSERIMNVTMGGAIVAACVAPWI